MAHSSGSPEDQWTILLDSSDRTTNSKRYRKYLNCLREKDPLQLEGDWRAFNRQFTACSVLKDKTLRKLMREVHCHNVVDLSYRQFDLRSVTMALAVLHLRHLGEHSLAFLTELFNLSAAKVDIPAIWKNSVYIPILKAWKAREEGRILPPYLAALPDSEDPGVVPPPDHRRGPGYSSPPARLQTESFYHLGPALYFC